MRFLLFVGLLSSVFLLSSCEKGAGIGGSAIITGTVKVQIWDQNTNLYTGTDYFAPETRVYIVYGENLIYDDDTRTHHDGRFQFKYLKKGTYTVFAYSECKLCPSGVEPIEVTIEVTKNSGEFDLGEIVVVEFQ